MRKRRLVLLATCVVVALLAAGFAWLRWQEANKLATVLSALAAVAAVGVAIWAALPASSAVRTLVLRSGKATSGPGGRATSGIRGKMPKRTGEVVVKRSGTADASAGGDAVSGVDLN